jgi:hypothetical protein
MNYFNIDNYINDGFTKIADVQNLKSLKWRLLNTNSTDLYSDHTSWVYMIVVGKEIVKIGETGQPLGIRMQTGERNQPAIGTHNRFGRLRGQGNAVAGSKDTDCYIRYELREEASAGKVSLWAKKCKQKTIKELISGVEQTIHLSSHKDIEQAYLTLIHQETGRLPRLNKSHK